MPALAPSIHGAMPHGVAKEVATVARSRIAFGLAVAPLIIALSACGTTMASDVVAPAGAPVSQGLVREQATSANDPDSELCWTVTRELPVMDLAGLDPESAEYFVEWGRYMREVDNYLGDRMPLFEAMGDHAAGPDRVAMSEALGGVGQMRKAVGHASRSLVKAKDPVRERTVRTFYLASSAFLEGLYTLCPSWRDDQV